jgi:hypothetical protein
VILAVVCYLVTAIEFSVFLGTHLIKALGTKIESPLYTVGLDDVHEFSVHIQNTVIYREGNRLSGPAGIEFNVNDMSHYVTSQIRRRIHYITTTLKRQWKLQKALGV